MGVFRCHAIQMARVLKHVHKGHRDVILARSLVQACNSSLNCLLEKRKYGQLSHPGPG